MNSLIKGIALVPLTLNIALASSAIGVEDRVLCGSNEGLVTDLRENNKLEVHFKKRYWSDGSFRNELDHMQVINTSECERSNSLLDSEDNLPSSLDETLNYQKEDRVLCGNKEGLVTDLRESNKLEVHFKKRYWSDGSFRNEVNHMQLINANHCVRSNSLLGLEDNLPSSLDESLSYQKEDRVLCGSKEGIVTDLRENNKLEVHFKKRYWSDGSFRNEVDHMQLINANHCVRSNSLLDLEDNLPSSLDESLSYQKEDRVLCGSKEGIVTDLRESNKLEVHFKKRYWSDGSFRNEVDHMQLINANHCVRSNSLLDIEDNLPSSLDESLSYQKEDRVLCGSKEGIVTDLRENNKLEVHFKKRYWSDGSFRNEVDHMQLIDISNCEKKIANIRE